MLHLLHPAAIHFAIAFLATGVLCELWGIRGAGERVARVERFGVVLSGLGAGALLGAIVTGYLAANTAPMPVAARAALDRHEQAGLILLGLVLVALLWKAWHRGRLPAGQRTVYGLLLLAILASLVWSAWLGGGLVYREGVGVRPGSVRSSSAPPPARSHRSARATPVPDAPALG